MHEAWYSLRVRLVTLPARSLLNERELSIMAVRLNPNESRAIGTMEGNSFERQPFPLLNFEDRSDPRSFCLPSKILISFLFQNIDHDALLRHSKTNNDQSIEYFLFVELFGGRRKCPYLKQKKKNEKTLLCCTLETWR